MKLINFLNKLIKKDGFMLIDADKNQYIIGKPEKKDPITKITKLACIIFAVISPSAVQTHF